MTDLSLPPDVLPDSCGPTPKLAPTARRKPFLMLKGCSFGKSCTSYVRVKTIIVFNVISEKLRKVNAVC